MFKLQTRNGNGRFADIKNAPTFATEAEAMAHAATYDEDGLVPFGMYRAVPVKAREEAAPRPVKIAEIFANPRGWLR